MTENPSILWAQYAKQNDEAYNKIMIDVAKRGKFRRTHLKIIQKQIEESIRYADMRRHKHWTEMLGWFEND